MATHYYYNIYVYARDKRTVKLKAPPHPPLPSAEAVRKRM